MSHAAATRVPILLATVALAHFALAGRFGLYSDDWSFFAPFVNDSLPQALARIGRGIGSGYEGRPLGAIAPGVVGYLIGLTGSFIAASVAGACIIACNAELLWRLVNRVAGPWYAWATALAFILSPVDLTRELPMHAVILQLSVTCTLVAAHFVATGRERAAPFIGLLSLLTYESPYFLLAAVPLLAATPWSRRRWLVFLVQLAVVFVVYGIVRAATGESRISDLST
ncbi:MAG: hypothetical protein JWM95_4808, partial [Gemmatimonadetes bacterium]|nr:hypothetical protein [Gemmatimonadota bacterium]